MIAQLIQDREEFYASSVKVESLNIKLMKMFWLLMRAQNLFASEQSTQLRVVLSFSYICLKISSILAQTSQIGNLELCSLTVLSILSESLQISSIVLLLLFMLLLKVDGLKLTTPYSVLDEYLDCYINFSFKICNCSKQVPITSW